MLDEKGALDDAPDLRDLSNWVRQHFGITYSDALAHLFVARVSIFCNEHRTTPAGLLAQCRAGNSAIVQSLAEALSTNYTHFFREREVVDWFLEAAIPTFPKSGLRIWSAACAGGEEAYSLAIALRDRLGDVPASAFSVLGTDISQRQLRSAEAGAYPARSVLAHCSDAVVRTAFSPAPLGTLQIRREIAQHCTFRRLNLTTVPWPFERKFHAIFLRNVLYYFDEPTVRNVANACVDALEPGGWLVTSVTDEVLELGRPELKRVRPAIYRKSGGARAGDFGGF